MLNWHCRNCGKSNESLFEVCWQCGSSRSGQPDPNFKSECDEPESNDPIWEPFRFSLGKLLLVVAFFSVVFAYIGNNFRQERKRDALIDLLKSNGALVDLSASGYIRSVKIIGERHKINTKTLECIERVSLLQELTLDIQGFSDEDLMYLSRLNNLHVLQLEGTDITGSGFQCLRGFLHLHTLDLSGSAITDEGLENMTHLTDLSDLDLSQTEITDDGLRHITSFPKLSALALSQTAVSDKGLMELKELKHLRLLYVDETKVTKQAIENLQKILPHIQIYN